MLIKRLESQNTTDSILSRQIELDGQQLKIVQEAIEISHHLNPTADLNILNPIRFVFCIEYFFSIYKEQRKITNIERFMLFEKTKYVSSSTLINFLTEYKKEVGEIFKREKVIISPESIIDCLDEKVLVSIQRIWNTCYDSEINAIPRENVDNLIERIYSDFNLKKGDFKIHQSIYTWRNDLSYFIIYEEFANLMRSLNNIIKIRRNIKSKTCDTCIIF